MAMDLQATRQLQQMMNDICQMHDYIHKTLHHEAMM